MILLKIIAKIVFLPLYLFFFCIACLMYFISLAFNKGLSFDEILCGLDIDTYWEL